MAHQRIRFGMEPLFEELSAESSVDDESMWTEGMLPGLIDRVEHWIRFKMIWDRRDFYDRRQMAVDVVYEADAFHRKRDLSWTIYEMTAMCSTIADRMVVDAIRNSFRGKNSVVLESIGNENGIEPMGSRSDSCADGVAEFRESLEQIWTLLNDDQKRVAELLTRDTKTIINDIASELETSASNVCRIRDGALAIVYKHLDIRSRTKEPRNQGTKERSTSRGMNAIDYFGIFPKWFGEFGIFLD